MIFFVLAWPIPTYQTSMHDQDYQINSKNSTNLVSTQNNLQKLVSVKILDPNFTPKFYLDKDKSEITNDRAGKEPFEIIQPNESEKLHTKNFLTSTTYDNKTLKESIINININNGGSKKENESKDLTYKAGELFMNLTVGGEQKRNNIKFSKVNTKDTIGLSNNKSTNQISHVENANSTLNNSTNYDKNETKLNRENRQSGPNKRNLNYDPQFDQFSSGPSVFENQTQNFHTNDKDMNVEKREIDDALEHGLKYIQNLVEYKEPLLYKLGFVLEKSHPAHGVANFGRPKNEKAMTISKVGYALLEASKKVAESYPENVSRSRAGFPQTLQSRVELDQCPLRGRPRCPFASRRFRTADGVCNNFEHPWRGAAMLPMQRFLPPVYEDGIQSIRLSILGPELPSARDISTFVHRDKNVEIDSVTLMFTQWGQFLDHDLVSTVKHLSFNGSTPRCCNADGTGFLPLQFLHPACLPIEVSRDDPFLSKFGIRCMEFTRSSPSTRIDCDLGWREQINQVTPYIDASMIYGSDVDTMDAMRTFRKGKIVYGRVHDAGPLNPPDPVDSELCRAGVITEECMQPGDGRFSEQPGLIAMHTVFVRYHNKIATVLSKLNRHWSDERTFQETRKIVFSAIQHITYREFLPIVLGPQVMELFELRLLDKGYYKQYESKINPAIANSFGVAAFRFGHSMVQNSFIRTDFKHVPLGNNVSLHEEDNNPENIWSFGAVDRLMLGFSNQPSQRRDEFIAKELTNHLFQFSDAIPFGMDLAAINVQRGRDHGLPPYTFWRIPCGLSPVKSWEDLERVMNLDVVNRLKSLYSHVDDVDLFTAGLAERPLRGGVVGPTFACIIAQQFVNLRRGDRFWYENGGFESSFTPAQLQQIKRISLAQILCQTMNEIETIQPFVFLSPDSFKNSRIVCNGPEIRNFDLGVWAEKFTDFENNEINSTSLKRFPKTFKIKEDSTTVTKKNLTKSSTIPKLNQIKIQVPILTDKKQQTKSMNYQHTNTKSIQNNTLQDSYYNDVKYLPGLVPDKTTFKPQVASLFSQNSRRSKRSSKTFKKKPNTTTTTKKTPTKHSTPSDTNNQHKIKITNISVKEEPAQTKYYQQTNAKPVQYYQLQDSDHNDVTYLLGLVPDRTTPKPQVAPVEVNIKIQYFAPTTSPRTVIIKKKPNTSYFETSKRPQTFYDSISITKRPSSKKPNIVTNYLQEYDRPSKRPHIVTPGYSYSSIANNYYDQNKNKPYRPSTYYEQSDSDYDSYYNYKPSKRPTNPYNTDQDDSDDSVVISSSYTNNKRPITNSYSSVYSTNSYQTNKRPETTPYDSYFDDNRPLNVNRRPVINSYNSYRPTYEETLTYNIDKRPTLPNSYNRDRIDSTDDVHEQFFNNELTKRPIFGQTNFTVPNRIHSTSTTKFGLTHINDKLDFKSRFMDKDLPTETDNDELSFVKIGTVHGEIKVHGRNAKRNKNGAQLFPLDEIRNKYTGKRVMIVDMDLEPSEFSNQWKIYDTKKNLSENHVDEFVPNLVNKGLFSDEIPKPMVNLSSNGEIGYVKGKHKS